MSLEHGDVIDRVDILHGLGKSEGVRISTRVTDDLIRTKVLFGEFFGRTGSAEELGLDKGVLTDGEVGRRQAAMIGGFLIAGLGFFNVEFKCLVEFAQVDRIFSGSGRGHVAFRVNGQVWMITFVGEERRDAGRLVRSIVVGKLGEGKERCPVILLEIAKSA